MASLSNLTKPIVIPTKVPAPPRKHEVQYAEDGSGPPTASLIELRACSEFAEYASAVDYFSSGSQLKTVQGFRGEPLIFAIGKEDRLNCLVQGSGVSQGWTLHNASPSAAKVVKFDVSVTLADNAKENMIAGLFITAVTAEESGTTKVHTAFVPASALKGESKFADGLEKIPWVEVADPKGGKIVTSVLIGSIKDRKSGQSATIVWAGTRQRELKASTYYTIDPTPGITDPWTSFSPDVDADQVLDLQPASFDTEDGVFSFSERAGRTQCTASFVDPETLTKTNSRGTLPGKLGKINSICSSRNPWNYTDLVFACEQGVSFINHRHPTSAPQEVSGLPKVSFREVVCSEKINPKNKDETRIVMFAVSADNGLYYIEGSRKWSTDGSISLVSSGLPIRQDISRISCQFNAAINSSELIYTGTGANEVKHLLRDPVTTCWSESTISFAAPRVLSKYKAYVTTISVQRSDGGNVGNDFPVKISSESMVVFINDRTYTLSSRATEVRTDAQGQITVVYPASESLKTTTYTVEIAHENVIHTALIDAAQRVIQGLSKLDTPEKLANARSTQGEAIFPDKSTLERRRDDFQQSAGLLKELPSMISAVSPGQGGQVLASTATPRKEITLERGPSGSGGIHASVMNASSHDSAWDSVSGFLGDALEFLRTGIKEAFKLVLRPVLKGIKFILKIAGKIISFVVEKVGSLIHAVGSFLKDTLGLDFGKLFKMLGLVFDPAKTKESQKILYNITKTALSFPVELIRSNTQGLNDFFDIIEAGITPYLGDNTRAHNSEDPNSILKRSPLGWIFDNPVLKILMKLNPLSIIMEAFSEVSDESEDTDLRDDFEIPNIADFLTPLGKTLLEGFQKVIAEFLEFLRDLEAKVSDSISDPSQAMQKLKEALQSAVWWLFNTIKTLVMTAWTAVGDLMDGLIKFLEAKWKLPFITSLFEWYAEQDFSIMNVATFVLCRILGIVVGEDKVATLLDPSHHWTELGAVAKKGDIFGGDLKIKMAEQTKAAFQSPSSGFIGASTINFSFMAQQAPLSAQKFSKQASVVQVSHTKSTDKKADAEHHLSEAAEARIHTFHKYSKVMTAFVGIFKFGTICLETTHLFAEVGAAPGGHGGGMLIPTAAVIGTGIAFMGSVGQLCNWLAAREFSDEVKQHLDENFGSICTGISLGLGCNLIATGASILSYTSRGSPGFAALSGFFLCLGSYGETIGVHLVPSFRSDKSDKVTKMLGILECVGTTGGLVLVAVSAAKVREPNTIAIALAVDGLSTFATTLTGLVLLAGDDSH